MDVKPKVNLSGFEGTMPVATPGNVPAFLVKLWKIVEDEKLDHIISWSQNGQTFKVHDQVAFAKDVLPKYYKHSNFSSFVRQVNMYGFRKIVDATSGGLKHDKDEWEFFHQYFQQGKPNILQQIKRKVPAKEGETKTAQVNALLNEVEQLKIEHENVASKLDNVRSENQLLWREVGDLRQQHRDQQAVINKLIQVFIKIVMNNKKDIPRGTKRRALNFPLNENKFSRPATQDVLPYTSGQVSQEILPYSGNQNVFNKIESLPPDTIYSVESPKSPFRLTELEDDNNQISVIEEAPLPNFSHTDGDVEMIPIDIDPSSDNTMLSNTSAPHEPFVVKNEQKTITVLPGVGPNSKASHETNSASQGFIFPEKYNDKVNVKSEQKKTKTCLNMDSSQIGFDCIKALSDQQNDEIITVLPSLPQENTLSTPETLNPPPPKVMSLLPAGEGLVTPVTQIPSTVPSGLTRQISFKDRDEISEDVQKINRSIEHLQDILDNQPILNLDLNNLNLLSENLPENFSIQDISKAMETAGLELAITGPQDDLENDKDEQPMSPSEYMDPSYGISQAELLHSVLQNHDSNNPGSSTS